VRDTGKTPRGVDLGSGGALLDVLAAGDHTADVDNAILLDVVDLVTEVSAYCSKNGDE
jgi:hypothetical protein